jgi:rubrerythrin
MKPAFDIPGTSVGEDHPRRLVSCLRCQQKLERYHLTRLASLSKDIAGGQAILVCPNCGHLEFIAEGSPLLSSLELASVDTGDGD